MSEMGRVGRGSIVRPSTEPWSLSHLGTSPRSGAESCHSIPRRRRPRRSRPAEIRPSWARSLLPREPDANEHPAVGAITHIGCPRALTSRAGYPHRHDRAAALAVRDAEPPAVGVSDLAAEREAEPGAIGLGRVERQRSIAQHLLGEAAAAVLHLERATAVALGDAERHFVLRRS